MTARRSLVYSAVMQGPLARYQELVADGALDADPAQAALATRLQALAESLEQGKRGLLERFASGGAKSRDVRGLYIWGGVGRGKSLLMDVFFNNVRFEPKARRHFHEFMLEAHARINAFRALSPRDQARHPGRNRKSPADPMPPVAHDLAAEAQLLCFDEFQVSDVADALILGRLLQALIANGVILVVTSNRPPDDLYPDGLNRQLFLPVIALLKARLDVTELAAARDFRLDRLSRAPLYHTPLGPAADRAMDAAWTRFICGAHERGETIGVQGRRVPVPRAARSVARFEFQELCGRPLGAADYLTIARRYDAVFVDRVPVMGPGERNEARRFIAFIDAMYEARSKLVCSAAGPPADLYRAGEGSFEFERTASRLIEMQSDAYLAASREFSATGAL